MGCQWLGCGVVGVWVCVEVVGVVFVVVFTVGEIAVC